MNIGGLYFEFSIKELDVIVKMFKRLNIVSILRRIITVILKYGSRLSRVLDIVLEKACSSRNPKEVIHKMMLIHKIVLVCGIAIAISLAYILR